MSLCWVSLCCMAFCWVSFILNVAMLSVVGAPWEAWQQVGFFPLVVKLQGSQDEANYCFCCWRFFGQLKHGFIYPANFKPICSKIGSVHILKLFDSKIRSKTGSRGSTIGKALTHWSRVRIQPSWHCQGLSRSQQLGHCKMLQYYADKEACFNLKTILSRS